MLQQKLLSMDEAQEVYEQHLRKDFAPDEVKPWKRIAQLLQAGMYRCQGFYEKGSLVGYAFLCDNKDHSACLLDYYAIAAPLRGQGYGSRIIKLLQESCENYQMVLLESEDPACAKDEQDYSIRKRRVDFYTRCGVEKAGFATLVFGVDYQILVLCSRQEIEEAVVRKRLKEVYQVLVTEEHFQKFVVL